MRKAVFRIKPFGVIPINPSTKGSPDYTKTCMVAHLVLGVAARANPPLSYTLGTSLGRASDVDDAAMSALFVRLG